MSESMIERVADRIARACGSKAEPVPHQLYRDAARAAIEAMREPDRLMIAAMNNAAASSYPGDNLELRMWRSGIDQALGERDKEAAVLASEDEGKRD